MNVRRDVLVLSLVACAIALVACKKTAESPAGPRQCKADDECVLSCDSKGDCCHDPYCEQAAHRDDAAEARAFNAERCTAEARARCPQIGARLPPDYAVTPRCRAGACVAEKTPLPDGATVAD